MLFAYLPHNLNITISESGVSENRGKTHNFHNSGKLCRNYEFLKMVLIFWLACDIIFSPTFCGLFVVLWNKVLQKKNPIKGSFRIV